MAALASRFPGLAVEAGELIRQAGQLLAADVAISPCTCDVQLWSLGHLRPLLWSTKRFLLKADGWKYVNGILPIPRGRLPLNERQSGLLIPGLAWGKDGPQLSLPMFWTLGDHADVVVEPEIRWERGARVITEGRIGLGPSGPLMVHASAGYDWIEDDWRGHGSLNGGLEDVLKVLSTPSG